MITDKRIYASYTCPTCGGPAVLQDGPGSTVAHQCRGVCVSVGKFGSAYSRRLRAEFAKGDRAGPGYQFKLGSLIVKTVAPDWSPDYDGFEPVEPVEPPTPALVPEPEPPPEKPAKKKRAKAVKAEASSEKTETDSDKETSWFFN